jgi:hypothetical protein
MDPQRISEDLLGVIFEAVQGDGYAAAVAPLMMVCRRWKVRKCVPRRRPDHVSTST